MEKNFFGYYQGIRMHEGNHALGWQCWCQGKTHHQCCLGSQFGTSTPVGTQLRFVGFGYSSCVACGTDYLK